MFRKNRFGLCDVAYIMSRYASAAVIHLLTLMVMTAAGFSQADSLSGSSSFWVSIFHFVTSPSEFDPPFVVAPLQHCEVVIKVVTWLVALALPLNSLLFFIRARCVFFRYPRIVRGFFALWLTTFTSITTPFAFEAIQLGPTRWCINSVVRGYSAAAFITIFIFDTSVFLAISIKISGHTVSRDWKGRIKAFVTGHGMGNVSKTLLKTGQMYYL